jgi:xanthine dehydrogenase YagS FAD-binding subunit
MLLALGASVNVTGGDGKRTIPLDKFFTLPSDGNLRRENVLKNDEIITDVVVPASKFAANSTYLKFKERDSMDFAMSAVAAAVAFGPDKTVSEARIVLGGVAPVPWRVPKAEAALVGKSMNKDLLAEIARVSLQGAEPLAKNAYKVPLTQTLVRRALAKVGGVA